MSPRSSIGSCHPSREGEDSDQDSECHSWIMTQDDPYTIMSPRSSVGSCHPSREGEDSDQDSKCHSWVMTQDDPRLETKKPSKMWNEEVEGAIYELLNKIWKEEAEYELAKKIWRRQVEIAAWYDEILQKRRMASQIAQQRACLVQKPYHVEEQEIFLDLQRRIQEIRVQNLGEELASRLRVRDKPDFLSPWCREQEHDQTE